MDERMDILRKYNLWTEGDFDFGFMLVAYTGRIMDYVGNRLVKVFHSPKSHVGFKML